MKKRNIAIILLVVAIPILIIIFKPKANPKIAFIVKNIENPFFAEMKLGAELFIQENNLNTQYDFDFKSGQSEQDINTQRELINSYIARDYDIICLTPSSSRELNQSIIDALESDIKIIIVDTKIDTAKTNSKLKNLSAYIGSDNSEGGKIAADFIVESNKDNDLKIIFFEGVPDQETAQMRKIGFMNNLPDKNKNIVESKIGNWSKKEAFDIMTNIIARNIEFNSIFCSNDEMALGVIDALERNNLDPSLYCIVGFDAIPEAITLINQQKLKATVRQLPNLMGRKAIELADKLIKGITVEYENEIKVELIK